MRKFTSVLLALVLCAALLCIGAAAADSGDASQFAVGDGTPENPYRISNADQLKAVEDNLSANYILTADINLGGSAENLWNPIEGPNGEAFTGTFDGNGHTISGLYMNAQSAGNQTRGLGLFSYLGSGGTIENLTVKGDIYPENSGRPVGGVAGKCSGGTISNCTSGVNINGETGATVGGVVGNAEVGSTIDNCRYTGTINVIHIGGNTMGMGGVVGQTSGCTISNCENAGTVKSNIWKGGIVGRNNGGAQVLNCRNSGIVTSNNPAAGAGSGGVVGDNYGTIENSYNTGAVTGGGCTGGVVGFNVAEDSNSTSGTIENCYNAGTVSGSGDVGGVAGYNNSSSATYTATIKSSYNTGTVINDGSGNVGGVVGWNEDRNDSSGIVTGCFYLKQGELKGIGYGDDSGNGARELTEDEFADPENFPGWNFTNTWIIDTPSEGGFARPMLRYNLETAEGSGTESDPYIIPDLEMLAFYRDMINAGSDSKYNSVHYKLTADIDLGGEENPWTPIGSNKDHAFTGTFDGDGHTISGLYINNGDSVYAGLFGYVGRGGMIKGLTVEGKITISGSTSCVGGIAGRVEGTEVSEMSVLTDSDDSKTGIIDCTSNVTINVTYNGLSVGGIVGSCGGATISGCENYGAVSVVGDSEADIDVNIGGIVGDSGSSTIISSCCNTGAVSAENADYADLGGIIGESRTDRYVDSCYNTGAVSVRNTEDAALGGIVGCNYDDDDDDESTVSKCYNTGAVSAKDAQNVNMGGVVGENRDGAVNNCYNTGAVSGGANTGGVVGFNRKGTVGSCYNTGAVSGGSSTGGVVGRNSSGAVSNSYNTGDVSAKASSGASAGDPVMAGGVVGYNDGGKVTNCYNIGTVSGENTEDVSVGGVVGYKDGGAVSNSYYLSQDGLDGIGTNEDEDSNAGAFPLTKEQFADTYSFTDWDFINTWTIDDMGGFERPVLRDNKETVVTYTYTVTVNGSYAGETGAGSYLAGASVTVRAGERAGYSFAGWTAEGVDLADESAENVTFTMPANDVTLTAEWDYIVTPGDPTYRPIIDEPENGGVTTSPSRPEAGDTVTVNPEPDEGYEVDEIIVTDKDGNPVEVTRNPDGSYSFTQPEGAVTIEVTFRPASGLPFTDVAEGDWFYDYVEYVYENGLMDGTSDTTFEPNANMTRAMVWAILARVDGETVTGANWVETAREWAMASGVSDGENANGYVTREQLATMLWRYAGEPASSYSLSAFTDADSVSDYAATAMAWAVEHGIITGVTDTALAPQGTATRAQCAAMLMRFVENVK
ncbi:MAG TPA: S-layer homology domain-containing protein [Candidatus Scatomorpha pullicola]|nr:S-layer homology domain-containing protein [Candidatus Scatomorpha pullicola]